MNRRRLAATAALLALAAVPLAPRADAAPAAVTADDYWLCLGLDGSGGTCIENPLPDLSGTPTVPQILQALLGGRR